MNNDLISVTSKYLTESVTDIHPLDGGHINSSYLVMTDTDKYVLQCLNSDLYTDHLTDLTNNYLQYKSACERTCGSDDKWICPEWLKTENGQFFHTDISGKTWRLYRYIPGDTVVTAEPFTAGMGLGKMHRILRACKAEDITPILPDLHNLKHYYAKYLAIVDVPKRDTELDRVISDNIDLMLVSSVPSDAIIHGDAKVSNMITHNDTVVSFVDLDTLMPGSVYDDLADCIRSCCMSKNGEIDSECVDRLLEGYEAGADMRLNSDMREMVNSNVRKNCFILGLRYYTDHLTGNRYFAESYPGQNIEKASRLLNLCTRIG